MNKREYIENIYNDAVEWMDENINDYDSFHDAYVEMGNVISGNYNGSYYCNAAKADDALSGVMWDDEVMNAVEIYYGEPLPLSEGPEICDVVVRMSLLYLIYDDIFDYWTEKKVAA